jgi:hypothetical protein
LNLTIQKTRWIRMNHLNLKSQKSRWSLMRRFLNWT